MRSLIKADDLDQPTRAAIIGAYRSALRVLDLSVPAEISDKRMTRVELISLVVDLAREGEHDERRLGAKAIFHALLMETRGSSRLS